MTTASFVATFTCIVATFATVGCDSPAPRKDVNAGEVGSDNQRWSRRLQCRQIAQAKIAADETAQQEAASRGQNRLLIFAPEYCYSETLNTCICDEHWIGDVYKYRAVV